MATLAEVHDAIQVRLDTISGLGAYAYPPQDIRPPFAFPALTDLEPIAMGRDKARRYDLEVFVFTAESARPKDGYRALLTYADTGADSIELAIWDGNDRDAGTFGGLANTSAHVSGFRALGIDEVNAYQMYGGVFTVAIHTKGS